MHGAGREMQMTCRITNPTLFSIQDLLFNHNLYIAPIDCEMLLGHDFLASNNVILNIGQGYMSINDKTVKLVLGGETPSAQPSVSRITIPSSVVVPPNSVMRMNCTVPVQDNDFVIEPNSKTTLLIPRSVCAKGQSPVVCFMNVTDNPVRLQGGIEVAEAHAVTVIESMDDPQELSVGTCSTSKQDQKSKLRTLLYTYSDVFARTEFDLGNFSHVEHEIDTGDARPIQLRMRRTPACFVQEEEAHLKKMLDAGVIQPSTSEWASAPVLIRKKDGGTPYWQVYLARAVITASEHIKVGHSFLCDVDEAVPLARKRKQKPRLLKRVATAMMMLFETPEKVSTLEQPAVPVESAVIGRLLSH
ncbi:Hypothetical predicted protein [Mytilus galloprovincialis]|uniref:Uncharacterized protein n=1 Tax=Mytilus galloprovincialis TaxID=29158 RepID=A0A8B6E546_MYTGA|nr:Hypothetical predicted protein [Mytilus galloprovincialis]